MSAWLLIFLAFYLVSSTFLPFAGPADLLWAGKGVPEARPGGLLGRQDQRARCQAFPSLMSYVVTRYLSFGYSLPHGEKKLDQSERQVLSLAVSLVLFSQGTMDFKGIVIRILTESDYAQTIPTVKHFRPARCLMLNFEGTPSQM